MLLLDGNFLNIHHHQQCLDSLIHLILQHGPEVDTNQQHPNPCRVAVSRVPLFSEFRADIDQTETYRPVKVVCAVLSCSQKSFPSSKLPAESCSRISDRLGVHPGIAPPASQAMAL